MIPFLDRELTFFKTTTSSRLYSIASLRISVGHPFSNNNQQHSVDKFLHELCERSNILRAHFLSKIKYTKFCRICDFQLENVEDELSLNINFRICLYLFNRDGF